MNKIIIDMDCDKSRVITESWIWKKKTDLHFTDLLETSAKEGKNIFPMDLSKVQPFVFSAPEQQDDLGDHDELIACPFQLFSIELSDTPVIIIEGTPNIYVTCIICHEVAPDAYDFYITSWQRSRGDHTKAQAASFYFPYDDDNEESKNYRLSILSVVRHHIDRLYSEKKATYSLDGRFKVRTKEGKKFYKPKNIIYIDNNINKRGYKPKLSGNVKNFRHIDGWSVRAHWRRIKGVGLNRLGERTIKGLTWVKEHERGEKVESVKIRKVVS